MIDSINQSGQYCLPGMGPAAELEAVNFIPTDATHLNGPTESSSQFVGEVRAMSAPDLSTPGTTENREHALIANLDEARRHLRALGPKTDKFVFQTFDDCKDRKDPSMARTFHGTLDEYAEALALLNQSGAGIFVTVNDSLSGGRKKQDITATRAMFREADAPDLPPLPIEPHLVIETSPGKKHEYILLEPTTDFELWEGVLQTVVNKHGGDPGAKGRNRVLRLAGFHHMKDPLHPHPVLIVHESGADRIALDELARMIPPARRNGSVTADRILKQPKAPTGEMSAYARAALDGEVEKVRLAAEGLRNDTLNRAAFSLGQLVAGGELSTAAAETALLDAATAAGLPEGEAMRTIQSGMVGGSKEPRQAPEPRQQSSSTAAEDFAWTTSDARVKNITVEAAQKIDTGKGVKAILASATVATVATVAVANSILPGSTVECDLDLEPDNIQRLRGALEVIPSETRYDRHTSSQIVGWGLRHVKSAIPAHVGAALSTEWDERTGGDSLEIFTTSDPNYRITKPVTTASIYVLAKEHGWTGQTPWPKPEPLIIHQQATPYPLDALPGNIGAAVSEVVRFVQAPVSLTACSALAVVSTAIQGLVDVRRADKLEGPTSIFTLVLADSGERKSSSDGHFSKPIQRWEAEKAEAAKPEIKKYNADVAAWEANRNGLMSAISTASKAGKPTEELALKMNVLEDRKPEEPRVPRLLYADATPEALAFSLAHKWSVGAVMSSEAGIVFGSHGMGKDSAMRNMSILNCFWDGAPVPIDRRTTTSYTVRNVRLTMGLAVQPETIRAFLDSSKGLARGIGFLARFLIAWPESTQGKRLFKEAPDAWPELGKFNRRIGALLDYPLTYDDKGYLSPVMLELSPKAKEAWVAFHDDVEAELNPGREMAEAKDVASKAADNAVRLAALFHVFEVGIEGQISVEHMSAGATIAGWHLYEARRFLGELAVDAGTSNAVTLDGYIIEYCKANHVQEISRRHIQIRGPNCTRLKEKLTAAIKELVDAGRIRETKTGKQTTIEINPKLLED